MRPFRVPAIVFALVLALVAAAPLPGEDKKSAPPPPTIDELVADLGHPVFATREKAQRELWKRGEAAIPALERVLTDENPEGVRRARELLDKFAWGIRPDTPPAVMKLLRQFQAGDRDAAKSAEIRKAAILDLLRHGPAGISVAKALLHKNLPDAAREQVAAQITTLLRREVPLRLFEGKGDEAAALISIHAGGTGAEGAADYAVFQVLRDDLPAAIAAAEAALKAGRRTDTQKLLLAHLYRASGEWAKARAAATDLPRPEGSPNLTELLREEEGDWKTLADTFPTGSANHPDAMRLSLLRLAGRDKDFEKGVEDLLKAANEYASAEEVFEAVVALFANDRSEAATNLLLEKKQNLGLLGEVLIQRLRYREALDLIASLEKPGKQLAAREKLEFDLRRARVLVMIGRRDDAVQLFGKVFDGLLRPRGRDGDGSATFIISVRALLRAEMRVGMKDLAAEHAAQFVTSGTFARHGSSYTGESAFEILFNNDSTVAETLFGALRAKKIPGDEPGPTMSRTRDLLAGKANKLAVDEALKALRDAPDDEIFSTEGGRGIEVPPREPSKVFQCRKQLAIGAVCRAANRDADAEAAYKAAAELASDATDVSGARSWVYGTSDAHLPYVEWGDFLCDRNRFHEAAGRYLEGWKKFPDQPLPLLLSGRALILAGDAKEGTRRMELSHWVSLGQERVRGRFIDELIRRGEGKAARRETELVLRACWCRDHYFGNVMNQAARASELVKDFSTAEKACQRSLLVMLKTQGMYYVETSAYMNVPHSILTYRARSRLDAGKPDEAVKLAREALAVTPGHIDLVSDVVPKLEKLGKKAEADELFGVAWKAYQKVLSDFPDSPAAKNALALLAANCRRELDKGLDYAREAVKAEPASVPFRETLAEVHFRRGERAKAAEIMAKLLEDDPRNALFKRQLARYRTGALDSPKPTTVD